MTILLTTFHIIFCLVLIIVILVQGGRGQGLSGPSFSSGNVQSLFGTRAADFLTKATSVSAICFLFTCIGLNVIEAKKSKSLLETGRHTNAVDIDAIKKALEKVKNDSSSASGKSVDAAVAAGKESAKGTELLDNKILPQQKEAAMPAVQGTVKDVVSDVNQIKKTSDTDQTDSTAKLS